MGLAGKKVPKQGKRETLVPRAAAQKNTRRTRHQDGEISAANPRSEGAKENRAEIVSMAKSLSKDIEEHVLRGARIEAAIQSLAEALRVSQPTNSASRFDIRWWLLRGTDKVRHPVLVRWVKQPDGSNKVAVVHRLALPKVKPQKGGKGGKSAGKGEVLSEGQARKPRGEEVCAAETRDLLMTFQKLRKMLQQNRGVIYRIKQTIAATRVRETLNLEDHEAKIWIKRRTIAQKLLDAGVLLDQKVRKWR